MVNVSVMRGLRLRAMSARRRGTLPNSRKKLSGGLARDLVERDAADLGQHLGGLDHIGRLVALAAVTAGREIGRVGLDQDAVGRQRTPRWRAASSEFLKVTMPVNEIEAPSATRAAGEVGPAGKAVQHSREGALPHFLFQDARHVVVGLARMDDERQAGFARRGDVGAESPLLRVARAELS